MLNYTKMYRTSVFLVVLITNIHCEYLFNQQKDSLSQQIDFNIFADSTSVNIHNSEQNSLPPTRQKSVNQDITVQQKDITQENPRRVDLRQVQTKTFQNTSVKQLKSIIPPYQIQNDNQALYGNKISLQQQTLTINSPKSDQQIINEMQKKRIQNQVVLQRERARRQAQLQKQRQKYKLNQRQAYQNQRQNSNQLKVKNQDDNQWQINLQKQNQETLKQIQQRRIQKLATLQRERAKLQVQLQNKKLNQLERVKKEIQQKRQSAYIQRLKQKQYQLQFEKSQSQFRRQPMVNQYPQQLQAQNIQSKIYCGTKRRQHLISVQPDPKARQKLVTTVHGFDMYVDGKDHTVSSVITSTGTWEPNYINLIGRLVKPGDHVLNLGSQSGLEALVMGKIIGQTGKLFIFEPYSFSNSLITKNVEINGLKDITTIYKYGASDEKGKATIKVSYSNTGGSEIVPLQKPINQQNKPYYNRGHQQIQQVDIDLVDSLLPQDIKLDFALLDVQKMQIKALRGMRQIIKRSPNLIIMTEWQYSGNPRRNQTQTIQFLNFMIDLNYGIYSYRGGNMYSCIPGQFYQFGNILDLLRITFLDIFFIPRSVQVKVKINKSPKPIEKHPTISINNQNLMNKSAIIQRTKDKQSSAPIAINKNNTQNLSLEDINIKNNEHNPNNLAKPDSEFQLNTETIKITPRSNNTKITQQQQTVIQNKSKLVNKSNQQAKPFKYCGAQLTTRIRTFTQPTVLENPRFKLANTIYGFDMYVDRNDGSVSNIIFIAGTWQPNYINLIGRLVKPGDHVLNLGSQSGLEALVMGKIIGETGKLFIFEPYSFSNSLITKNVEINGLKDITTIYKYGASDEKGMATIKVSYSNTGGSQIFLNESVPPKDSNINTGFDEMQQIFVDKVDSLLPSNISLNFALLDVQKMQIKALKGMRQIIKRSPNLIIMTEWQYDRNPRRNQAQTIQLLNFMRELGYKIYSYNGGSYYSCILGQFYQYQRIQQLLKISFIDLFFFPSGYTIPK